LTVHADSGVLTQGTVLEVEGVCWENEGIRLIIWVHTERLKGWVLSLMPNTDVEVRASAASWVSNYLAHIVTASVGTISITLFSHDSVVGNKVVGVVHFVVC
jgi:hypothetical protein